MRVVPLEPDLPKVAAPVAQGDASGFTAALGTIAQALGRADIAENAYAAGSGTLQDAVLERARADIALAIAAATAQRTATAMQSVLNLQI